MSLSQALRRPPAPVVAADIIRFSDAESKQRVKVEFRSTHTVDEALEVLAELGADALVLAGGTDLMVQYQRGELAPRVLVHIERLEALAGVTERGGKVELGALVTHRRVATDPELAHRLPALAEAAATVGGWQTQAVGTVAGNVCNASPAADTVPPLLVAATTVQLASRTGRRSLPLQEFLLGRRQTARSPEELVTGLELEPLPAGAGETYLKVAPRSGMEVALVGLATRLHLSEDGETVADVRIAACSVAPVPFRATEAEAALIGTRLDRERLRQAGELLAATAAPIDDARATAAYRRKVIGPLLGRAAQIARDRARGAG